MGGRWLKLKAQTDFVERLSQAPIFMALEELIWNSFDERSTEVTVSLTLNKVDAVDEIVITDNGRGMEHARAAEAFENLGSSNKAGRSLETGEPLHGRKGEGRHKALSLGAVAIWHFTYKRDGKLYSYDIVGKAGQKDPFYLHDESEAGADETVGCRVTISQIRRSLYAFTQADARRQLASQFAPFLLGHKDRTLVFHGRQIRPQDAIEKSRRLRPFSVSHNGEKHSVAIQIIHWSDGQRRECKLCSQNGIPLHEVSHRTLSASGSFSIFARSTLFDALHEQNLLSTVEITSDKELRSVVNTVQKKARAYFRALLKQESTEALDRLRDEGSYPYAFDPQSDIDRVERRVFDLCAVNISRHLPSFSEKMDVTGRKLLLKIVREAITQNPSSVGRIIREVCKLPEESAKTFSRLLDDVPLKQVVNLAHQVSTRLQFLKLFEAIIYLNPFEERIKERTQLQRLLVGNTWLFGEEYSLGTDDENLGTILLQHIQILGRRHLQPDSHERDLKWMIAEYKKANVKTEKSLSRIPDLMLFRKFIERRPEEYEFLVIEIKRPGVPIGRKEINQIEDYAKAVVSTPFADSERTRWVFVVVSDELDEYATDRARQQGLPPGVISKPSGLSFEIRALPWSYLIRSATARHEHLQEWLGASLTQKKVLKLAEETYAEYLPNQKRRRSAK